jgi:hypothetical protein
MVKGENYGSRLLIFFLDSLDYFHIARLLPCVSDYTIYKTRT